mgnify:CR=1 FL=1
MVHVTASHNLAQDWVYLLTLSQNNAHSGLDCWLTNCFYNTLCLAHINSLIQVDEFKWDTANDFEYSMSRSMR